MTKPTSRRGRPEDPQAQAERKTALMDAALMLLETKSYRSITIREIAESASTKSAMISYYFGSKEGLFVALLERYASKGFGRMQRVIAADDPLRGFIDTAITNFAENPAITRLLVDEVISHEGPLREGFIGAMPKKIARFLPEIIRQQQEAGRIRRDADPKWLAFSLANLIVTPFIGAVVRERAWEISHEEVCSAEWSDHIYRLFCAGALNWEEPKNTKENKASKINSRNDHTHD